jgi:L-ascorbate metabolism protein UlaG (beta-lactamase superfamily)
LAAPRKAPAACAITDLPQISLVLISHNHYDHLEYEAIRVLVERFPDVQIAAPLGTGELIAKWGFGRNVTQFDWRQRDTIDGIEVTCWPARHACCRTGFDFCAALWCSWLVRLDRPEGPRSTFPETPQSGRTSASSSSSSHSTAGASRSR